MTFIDHNTHSLPLTSSCRFGPLIGVLSYLEIRLIISHGDLIVGTWRAMAVKQACPMLTLRAGTGREASMPDVNSEVLVVLARAAFQDSVGFVAVCPT